MDPIYRIMDPTQTRTQTYVVENLLSIHRGFKTDIMSRFVKFYKNLLKGPSTPVRILAALMHTDIQSTSGQNLALITTEIGKDPFTLNKKTLDESLEKRCDIPEINFLKEINSLLGISLGMKMNGYREEGEMDNIRMALKDLCV